MKKTWRAFTPEENEIIRSDYADYVDVRVTAEKLGRDFGTIRQRLYTMGLKRDRTVLKMLKWCPEHLKPILKEKGSAAFIAAVNAHSEQLEKSGAEVTHSAELPAQISAIDARPELERREKMSAMRAIGLTLREIGEHFGVSGERARQLTDRDYRRATPRTGSVDWFDTAGDRRAFRGVRGTRKTTDRSRLPPRHSADRFGRELACG
jgi:DNA-directed RNA polymerase sigma subunit (sigma70/sigma32)